MISILLNCPHNYAVWMFTSMTKWLSGAMFRQTLWLSFACKASLYFGLTPLIPFYITPRETRIYGYPLDSDLHNSPRQYTPCLSWVLMPVFRCRSMLNKFQFHLVQLCLLVPQKIPVKLVIVKYQHVSFVFNYMCMVIINGVCTWEGCFLFTKCVFVSLQVFSIKI